jgi:hypothetical protein
VWILISPDGPSRPFVGAAGGDRRVDCIGGIVVVPASVAVGLTRRNGCRCAKCGDTEKAESQESLVIVKMAIRMGARDYLDLP